MRFLRWRKSRRLDSLTALLIELDQLAGDRRARGVRATVRL
jgi:hypothetical protein